MTETLLCRRFDLSRASGSSLDDLDPVVRHHVESCAYCQEAMRLDQAARDAMQLGLRESPLPPAARRRIEALVAVRVREARRPLRIPLLTAAGGVAAAVAVLAVLLRPWSAESGPLVAAPPVAGLQARAEPVTGLGELVARHRGLALSGAMPSQLPDGAMLYHEKLPPSLASRILLQTDEFTAAAWAPASSPAEVSDATFFVLDAAKVVVDPVIRDVLAEAGSLTLPHGAERVTIAARGGRVFVVVASTVEAGTAPSL